MYCSFIARLRADGDRPPTAALDDGRELTRRVDDQQHLAGERSHLDDAADHAVGGDDAVIASDVIARAAIDRDHVLRRFGIVADHGRGDAGRVLELSERDVAFGGNPCERFGQRAVLGPQTFVLRSQFGVGVREPGRVDRGRERAPNRVGDGRDGKLSVGSNRGDGGGERASAALSSEVDLEQCNKRRHNDDADYRE